MLIESEGRQLKHLHSDNGYSNYKCYQLKCFHSLPSSDSGFIALSWNVLKPSFFKKSFLPQNFH